MGAFTTKIKGNLSFVGKRQIRGSFLTLRSPRSGISNGKWQNFTVKNFPNFPLFPSPCSPSAASAPTLFVPCNTASDPASTVAA